MSFRDNYGNSRLAKLRNQRTTLGVARSKLKYKKHNGVKYYYDGKQLRELNRLIEELNVEIEECKKEQNQRERKTTSTNTSLSFMQKVKSLLKL